MGQTRSDEHETPRHAQKVAAARLFHVELDEERDENGEVTACAEDYWEVEITEEPRGREVGTHTIDARFATAGAALDGAIKWCKGRGLFLEMVGQSFAVVRKGEIGG